MGQAKWRPCWGGLTSGVDAVPIGSSNGTYGLPVLKTYALANAVSDHMTIRPYAYFNT